MSPDDPRHGTTAGYRAGCSESCCREAQNAYERRRRKHRQVYGTSRQVDPTGTRRRIHALMALGHTSKTIALACGWTTGEAVLEVSRRNWVEIKTAAAVSAAFERLSMTVGASDVTRRYARRKGWPPPLAWDNIDDPDEQPVDWEYRSSAREEIVDDLDERGAGINEVLRALDVSRGAFERWCQRYGRHEQLRRLINRDELDRKTNQWTREAS